MPHNSLALLAPALLLVAMAAPVTPAEAKTPAKKASVASLVKVGDLAPAFTLLAFDGKDIKKISLADFRGKKNVALAFYPFAFTGG